MPQRRRDRVVGVVPDAALVEEIRGEGLLTGLKIKDKVPAGDVVKACLAEHLLTVGESATIRGQSCSSRTTAWPSMTRTASLPRFSPFSRPMKGLVGLVTAMKAATSQARTARSRAEFASIKAALSTGTRD